MKDINSLSYSSWRCKYHKFFIIPNIIITDSKTTALLTAIAIVCVIFNMLNTINKVKQHTTQIFAR